MNLKKLNWLATLVVILTLALPWAVFADDIYNGLDNSIDAQAEEMPLNAGGVTGSTYLYVQPRNGDGNNGCNIQGGEQLVVAVSSSNPAVATVAPTSITFTSCGDTPQLTVTPLTQGSTSITLSQTSNNTGGTFNFATATFTVNVAAPANTAPTVTISGVTGGASYEIGTVLAPMCNVVDVEDGDSSFAATVTSDLNDYGLGTQTASCSYTDGGGLTASASVTYNIVDTTAPTIALLSRTPANSNGWNNTDVVVVWSCSDTGSGVVSPTVTETVSAEAAGQSVSGICTDNAGLTATDTVTDINIDKTAPTASATAAPAANSFGWNNTDITVSFAGADALSGIDFCSDDVVLSSEGADQLASGTCADKAGNVSDAAGATVSIDKTNPLVSLVGGPADGGVYYYGFVPAAPTCSASDALSGLNGVCSVAGYSSALGSHTVTASASDKAGNSASASASYTVNTWTLNGFYQPVDMNGVYNIVKGGSTVPLKFEVFAGPTELTATTVVASFVQTKIVCSSSAVIDEIEVTSTGGTSLRYDTTGGQFIQNWATPKLPGQCYTVTMTTQDGTSLTAYFKLK